MGPHDAGPHAGQVVRRVLLRRNIVIDAETAQLRGRGPSRAPGRCAFPAAEPDSASSLRRLRARHQRLPVLRPTSTYADWGLTNNRTANGDSELKLKTTGLGV